MGLWIPLAFELSSRGGRGGGSWESRGPWRLRRRRTRGGTRKEEDVRRWDTQRNQTTPT